MKILTTNRFLNKALLTVCCAGALGASSTWATVVNWQLNPDSARGDFGAKKVFSQSGYATTAWGVDKTPLTDVSHQFLFKAATESGAAREASTGLSDVLNRLQASDADVQQESRSTLSQGGAKNPIPSKQSDESLLFAASNASTRPATELEDAMARTNFDEEFVSVPTVQFASMARGSMDVSVTSATNVGVVPVPEMSAFFPIIGLIVAVSCTQILRRRRVAQQRAFRRLV